MLDVLKFLHESEDCKFFKTPLSRNSQKRLEHKENQTKCRKMTRNPGSHVRILTYRTWAISVNIRLCIWYFLLGSIPRGMSPPTRVRKERMSEKEDREKAPKPEAKRIRQFRSKHWKLEPRVRFLSWAGKNMDPVNIDWVLQKLGFSDAQLTIPKWAQRGAMDPMDTFLSVLVDRLLAGMQESSSYLGDEE